MSLIVSLFEKLITSRTPADAMLILMALTLAGGGWFGWNTFARAADIEANYAKSEYVLAQVGALSKRIDDGFEQQRTELAIALLAVELRTIQGQIDGLTYEIETRSCGECQTQRARRTNLHNRVLAIEAEMARASK